MTLDCVDYSYGRPNPSEMAAEGIKLACRYLSNPPNSKNLSAGEAAALHAAGIGVLLNWESDPGRPLLGAAAGTQDGQAAAALAEQIGAPHGLTIFYSCDRDINASQYPQINAYYQAAAQATAGRYLVGMYGEADLVNHLYGHSSVTSYWQTLAWSHGQVSPHADLYQYAINQSMAGASVDFNTIIHAESLGAWWPAGLDPSGGGTPITEDDMFNDDDRRMLLNVYAAIFNGGVSMPDGGRSIGASLQNITAALLTGGVSMPDEGQSIAQSIKEIHDAVKPAVVPTPEVTP